MQIRDLVKTIDTMTEAELLEHVRAMRHRREVIRPARQAKIDKAAKKETKTKVNKTLAAVEQLSEEERLKLITMLGG